MNMNCFKQIAPFIGLKKWLTRDSGLNVGVKPGLLCHVRIHSGKILPQDPQTANLSAFKHVNDDGLFRGEGRAPRHASRCSGCPGLGGAASPDWQPALCSFEPL